jgi:hypothetical protein
MADKAVSAEKAWSEMTAEESAARLKAAFEAANAEAVKETKDEIAALDSKIEKAHKDLETISNKWVRKDIESSIDTLEDDAHWLQTQLRNMTSRTAFEQFLVDRVQEILEDSLGDLTDEDAANAAAELAAIAQEVAR